MNKEQLLDAVGQVEDTLVEEAALPANTVKFYQRAWFKPAVAAACCVLVVSAVLNGGLFRMGSSYKYTASSSAMAYDTAAGGAVEETEMAWTDSYDSGYGMNSSMAEAPAEAPAPSPGEVRETSVKEGAFEPAKISRKIIYTAGMTMETTEFDNTLKSLLDTVEQLGGYVESCDQGGKGDYSSRWYSAGIRIPTERYNSFISGAQELASVTYLSQSTQDITLNYVDTQARITSLETQRDRLNELAAKAETVEDLIYIQGQLSDVEYRLESYASQLRVMDDQVYMSTINLDLREVRVETPVENSFGKRLGFAIVNGWNYFVDGVQDIIIEICFNLPLLVLLIGAAAAAIIIFWKKRKTK